jgi:hypothetical protein
LEKDLGNSIKDWNDILPAVLEVEALYASLDQKEMENERIKSDVETLKAELEKEKTWGANEKEELNAKLASKEKEAEELRLQTNELKRIISTATSTLTTSGTMAIGTSGYSGFEGKVNLETYKMCHNCGKLYSIRALGENGLCDECNARKT